MLVAALTGPGSLGMRVALVVLIFAGMFVAAWFVHKSLLVKQSRTNRIERAVASDNSTAGDDWWASVTGAGND
jgi:hypothetical protein